MKWIKIIAFKNNKKKEVGCIEASTSNGIAYFKITGRIWSWTADDDSILSRSIEEAISSGIKDAKLYLSSGGGSVFATNEIANLLDQFDDVKIEVGSLMASAATYLTSRFHTTIKQNTQGMIHMPLTSIRGNLKQVKADLKLLENITEDYATAYSKKTGKTVKQIKALWNDGDYWMNSKQLKKEGFVDAIAGEIDAFSESDVMALVACGAPTIPEKTKTKTNKNQNNSTMDKEELIALYGLEANATDQQIMEAAKTAKIDAVKHRNSEKEAKEKKDSEKGTEAKKLVKTAFDDKKIKADQIPHYEKLAEADFDSTKTILEAMTSIPQLSKEINPSTSEVEAGREKWTLEDYLEKDPEAYEQLKTDSPKKAEALEAGYFGKQ